MSSRKTGSNDRRALLSGLGIAAVAGVALGGSRAEAKKKSAFEPKRHQQDAWMDALPGTHRVFIDTDDAAGASNALLYATNILNAQASGYQGKDADMAIVVCLRHASTPLGYDNAMWAKYGATFGALMRGAGPGGGAAAGTDAAPPVANAQASALGNAAKRGVQFAICNAATTLMAGMIARQAGTRAEDVHDELVAHLVPNARMVPAGVMAVTRAQEYGYSLLYAAG
jgi:intracellular sulfur oxidation DsrE/DsrF family protein